MNNEIGGLNLFSSQPPKEPAPAQDLQIEQPKIEQPKIEPTVSPADKAIREVELQRTALNNQINTMINSAQTRSTNQLYDPKLMGLAQGLLAPTKTGGFGESLGAGLGKFNEAATAEEKDRQENAKMRMEMMEKGITMQEKQIISQLAPQLFKKDAEGKFTGEIDDAVAQKIVALTGDTSIIQKIIDLNKPKYGNAPAGSTIYDEKTGKAVLTIPDKSKIPELAQYEERYNDIQAKLKLDPNNDDLKRELVDTKDKINKISRLKEQIVSINPGPPPASGQVDFYANLSLNGDYSWKAGMSRTPAGKALLDAVSKRMPTLAAERGLEYSDIGAITAEKKALSSALTDRTKFVANGTQFINNFNKQGDLVMKYAGPGTGGTIPIINRWIQAGRRQIVGDSEVNQLDVAIRGLAREHQRIVTGLTSNAQLHAGAAETADQLLNTDMTADQIAKTVAVMREEAVNALDSGKGEVADLKAQLRHVGRDFKGAPEASAAPLPKGMPEGSKLIGKSADGKHDVYQAPDGKKYIAE